MLNRLIANVVKHAEGRSAEELRNVRSDVFIHPHFRDEGWSQFAPTHGVYSPLAGEDIYLTIDDLKLYQTTLVSFWQEFGEVIKNF